MKSIIFAIAFIILVIPPADAQHRQINFEDGKWKDILEKSKKENKMIYLDCYAVWCGPCKWMAKNVFTNDTVADFYNSNFVNVEMDMEKGEGIELAKQFGIQAYPTMLYLNSSGEIIHRTCGSTSVANFTENGKDALDPAKQLATAVKKFNGGNTNASIAFNYFALLQNGCQNINPELSKYFAAQKDEDLLKEQNWQIIYHYSTDYSSREFNFLEKNKEAFVKLYNDSVQVKINDIYTKGLNLAIRKKDEANYEILKKKVKESGNPDADKLILGSDIQLYAGKGDWKNYGDAAVKYVGKYLSDDAMGLNSFAWNFYEKISDPSLLEEAAKWAKRSVELQDLYANNDTYAAVLYKLGKKEDAEKVAKKAIVLAKEKGENYSETEELLKKIGKLRSTDAH
jgi:thiol-disulfide isomerase/thioredoxin